MSKATTPFKRMKRTLIIHVIVQIFLMLLLIYMSLHFQTAFNGKGTPQAFLNSIIFSVILQMLAFYPLKKLAEKEAKREVAADAGNKLDAAAQKALRHSRLFSDIIKASVVTFVVLFVALAPQFLFLLSTVFFTFILITITYFQCFNFAARKAMKG